MSEAMWVMNVNPSGNIVKDACTILTIAGVKEPIPETMVRQVAAVLEVTRRHIEVRETEKAHEVTRELGVRLMQIRRRVAELERLALKASSTEDLVTELYERITGQTDEDYD